MPFVSGRLRNYLLREARQSHSNASLLGPWGKSTSQVTLGSNVWTTYSNSDHLGWRDEKILSPHAVLEDGKRRATGGCQLREREGHHPLRGEQHDCLQLPGISPAPAGGRKSSKALQRLAVGWRSRCSRFITWICLTSNEDRKCLTLVLPSVLCYTINTKHRRRKEAAVSGEAASNEVFMSDDVKFWQLYTLTAF